MRIAAKRLRYVLEVTAPCFGPYARKAIRHVKNIQALLGDVHDCDVALPEIRALLAECGEQDAAAPGLRALAERTSARRERTFDEFRACWKALERNGFRARVQYAIEERPPAGTVGGTTP
jgi:CHAD domain-containing protein